MPPAASRASGGAPIRGRDRLAVDERAGRITFHADHDDGALAGQRGALGLRRLFGRAEGGSGVREIDSLLGGTKWGGAVGTGATITYSFPGYGAVWASPYSYVDEPGHGFSPLSHDAGGGRAGGARGLVRARRHHLRRGRGHERQRRRHPLRREHPRPDGAGLQSGRQPGVGRRLAGAGLRGPGRLRARQLRICLADARDRPRAGPQASLRERRLGRGPAGLGGLARHLDHDLPHGPRRPRSGAATASTSFPPRRWRTMSGPSSISTAPIRRSMRATPPMPGARASSSSRRSSTAAATTRSTGRTRPRRR